MTKETAEDRSKRWAKVLQEEETAFQKAVNGAPNMGPARHEALARDWFNALKVVLAEFYNWPRTPFDGEPFPFPCGPIQRIVSLSEELAAGRMPLLAQDVTAAGGRPSRPPLERRDIATALSFIKHVKEDRISEKAFIVMVSEAFGVDRTTVQRWCRDSQEITQGLPEIPVTSFPDALEMRGKPQTATAEIGARDVRS